MAKPKKRKSYCYVCECGFKDYLEVEFYLSKHIKTEDHATGIKFSRFNNDINELAEKYAKKYAKSRKISKDTKQTIRAKNIRENSLFWFTFNLPFILISIYDLY